MDASARRASSDLKVREPEAERDVPSIGIPSAPSHRRRPSGQRSSRQRPSGRRRAGRHHLGRRKSLAHNRRAVRVGGIFVGAVVIAAVLALCLGAIINALREGPSAQPTDPSAGVTPVQSAVQAPVGGPFTAGSVWKQRINAAPTAPNSSALVANLAAQAASLYNGNAAFNVAQYGTSFYSVGPDTPRVDVAFNDCQHKGYTPTGLLGPRGQFTSVPIPVGAVPAEGTDSELTIYSPSSDQLWEFWVAQHSSTGWSACWGGRIDHVSKSPGYFTVPFGASASGLALAGGMVSIADVTTGRIDHAVSLQIISPAAGRFSWPARRTDGTDSSPNAIPEGTRFRLDPNIDVTTLGLTPIATMIAKAAQTYGFIVTDRSGCVAVQAESGSAVLAATGSSPWAHLLGGTPDYLIMHNFPWSKLQALPENYGKP